MKIKNSSVKFLAMALGMSFGLASSAGAEELKLSHFMPSQHPFQSVFMKSWIEEVGACTKGDVKVTVFPAGSAFGHVAKQLDQVKAGVVDIAHGLTGIPRGRLPRTSIVDLPLMFNSASSASNSLWDLYESGMLGDEYKGLKVLALHAHNPGLIHTKGKAVNTPEDLKGLRIRFPSLAISIMLKQLGANPVGLPPTQVYENLQKGVIDGTVFPWDAIGGMKLYEVLDNHADVGLYTTSFYFVMNEKKYNSLSASAKSCIDKASGRSLVAKLGNWWNEWDKPGQANSVAKGNKIVSFNADARKKWETAVAPVVPAYLEELAKQGVKDPKALYEAAKAAAEKNNAK